MILNSLLVKQSRSLLFGINQDPIKIFFFFGCFRCLRICHARLRHYLEEKKKDNDKIVID